MWHKCRICRQHRVSCSDVSLACNLQLILPCQLLGHQMVRTHVHVVCFFRQQIVCLARRYRREVPLQLNGSWQQGILGAKHAARSVLLWRREATADGILNPQAIRVQMCCDSMGVRNSGARRNVIELLFQKFQTLLTGQQPQVHKVIETLFNAIVNKLQAAQVWLTDTLFCNKFQQPINHRQIIGVKSIFDNCLEIRRTQIASPRIARTSLHRIFKNIGSF